MTVNTPYVEELISNIYRNMRKIRRRNCLYLDGGLVDLISTVETLVQQIDHEIKSQREG